MKRRILFFHYEFPGGGGERVTRDTARYIQSFGYESYVITLSRKQGLAPEVILKELPDKQLESDRNAEFMVDLIRSLSIDVFVLAGFFWGKLEYVKKNTNCKFVYILHNMPLWEAIAKQERRRRIKHSLFKRIEWYLIGYPKVIWGKSYFNSYTKKYRKMYDWVDAYVVLCEPYKKELMSILRLSEEKKIFVIHNSEKSVEHVNLNKKKQIVFVGNLIYENKRVDRLLDIWGMIYKKLPDWELILVGGGKEQESLQKQASQTKLERVIFAGGSHDVQSYYRDASVSCLTSTFEGWPLCLTEAQSNGVVPIAFNSCAGIEEILSPSGVNGVLVAPFNKKAFAHALYQLLTSPGQLEKMRNNVILKSQQYSIDTIGEQWTALFDALLEIPEI